MKNINKRLLSIILSLVIVFSMSATAFAQVDSNSEQDSQLITENINDTSVNMESLPLEFVDENGDPLQNVKITEFNKNASDEGYNATFEIRQETQDNNNTQAEPKGLVIALGEMSVEKIAARQYRITYSFQCTSNMTLINLTAYKKYPNETNPYIKNY